MLDISDNLFCDLIYTFQANQSHLIKKTSRKVLLIDQHATAIKIFLGILSTFFDKKFFINSLRKTSEDLAKAKGRICTISIHEKKSWYTKFVLLDVSFIFCSNKTVRAKFEGKKILNVTI